MDDGLQKMEPADSDEGKFGGNGSYEKHKNIKN